MTRRVRHGMVGGGAGTVIGALRRNTPALDDRFHSSR
jgi:hypothetical protein